jgi:hypothetical protein
MGEGFIVRRGGGGQQTVKPIYNSLTEVDFTSLTLSVTNDSGSIATLYYSVVNNEPAPDQADTFDTEFVGKETKDITITGLTSGTTYTVYLKAIAIGEFPSETIIVPDLTTGVAITATGGTIEEFNLNDKRYKRHIFTGNGTFTVTQLSNLSSTFNEADYLIVAGGGGGSGRHGGGGGGGGYIFGNRSLLQQSYSIGVGNGGTGVEGMNRGTNGGNSSFAGETANGGGTGGVYRDSNLGGNLAGVAGGCGGGGGYNSAGASSNQGAVANGTAFGFAGANGSSSSVVSGGGGGAGAAAVFNSTNGGNGGPGRQWIDNFYYCGGGGGSSWSSGKAGDGGIGGGGGANRADGGGGSSVGKGGGSALYVGANGIYVTNNGVIRKAGNGGANTGGGGGGGEQSGYQSYRGTGGNGGSGIVIIQYEIAPTT